MATTDRPRSAALPGAVATGRAAAGAAATGAGAGDGSSRRNFTVGRWPGVGDGLAATTCTREVSCLGFGASAGRPRTAVSFLASSSGEAAGLGGTIFAPGGAVGPAGPVPRPVNPGGRLMRTVSFLASSAGRSCSGFSSAMGWPSKKFRGTIRAAAQRCQSVSRRKRRAAGRIGGTGTPASAQGRQPPPRLRPASGSNAGCRTV